MRLVLKACQRVGVEHEGAPRLSPRQRGFHLGAGFGADAKAGAKRNGVYPGVREQRRNSRRPLGFAQHDARQCAGVDRHRLSRTRQRHQSRAAAQRGDSSQSRGAGERSAAGNDKRMSPRVFVWSSPTWASASTAPRPRCTMSSAAATVLSSGPCAGFRHCVAVGQKVGLRLTLTRHTAQDLDRIFDFIEAEGIDRACFYHLCPSGRGKSLLALTPEESRKAIDMIIDRTGDFARRANASKSSPSTTTAMAPTSTSACSVRTTPGPSRCST